MIPSPIESLFTELFACRREISVASEQKGRGTVYVLRFFLAPPSANWFIVFIFSDDDLGKSDSSSGSMDSIQVGPAFSDGSSRRVHLHV